MYTKKELADAVAKFIGTDLVADIDDKRVKFALCMAKKALKENPDLMDGFLDSPIVANVIKESDGGYDVDSFLRIMKNVLSDYGSYAVEIPKIPMFAPKEAEVMVTAEDIDKIVSYLRPEVSSEAIPR